MTQNGPSSPGDPPSARREPAMPDRDRLEELQDRNRELERQIAGLRTTCAEMEIRLQRYSELYEGAPIGYVTLDRSGVINGINQALAGWLGYDRATLIGQAFAEFVAAESRSDFNGLLAASFAGTQSWGEFGLQTADRRPLFVRIEAHLEVAGSGSACLMTMQDITEHKKTAEAAWRQANYDQLTGLPNRRLCLDRLQFEIDRMARSRRSLALLFIDLDRFKEINDTLGHPIGDLLLAHAALRICGCVRGTDTVARLGGDEFIVIMSDLAGTDRVGLVAQAIVQGLAAPFHLGGKTVHLSASVGVTLYPTDAVMMTELLKHADQAMYAAKSLGRNRFNYFTPEMQAATVARLGLIKDLRDALAKHQFEVYFQPIVDLKSGRAVKAEALLRWHHPTFGLMCPSEFIEAADDSGLIHEIGDWVFRESARWIARNRRADDGAFQVSVNKSPVQLVAGDTQHSWLDYLKQIGVPGKCLVIEVTEGLLLSGRPEILGKLQRLQQAGVGLAIDDFGTGYSALSCLKALAVDYLKIDRVFIRDLFDDADVQTLVRAIIAMAHAMGITVIAEGVETVEQRDWLAAEGCDYAQGFYFAAPLPAGEIDW